ncbi:MAG: family 16 glycoside hydrolase [bacterium]
MQKSTAFALVGTTTIAFGGVLVVALSTVISRPSKESQALAGAREDVKSALDAPRPEDVAVAQPSKPAESTSTPDVSKSETSKSETSKSDVSKSSAAKPAAAPLPTPTWIWAPGSETQDAVAFNRRFRAPEGVKAARLVIAVDNASIVKLDGKEIARTTAWEEPSEVDLGALAAGVHEIVVDARNEGGPAGLCAMIEWTEADGTRTRVVTDPAWQASGAFSATPVPSTMIANLGEGPWGAGIAESFGGAPGELADIARAIAVPPGFICELVYVAPRARGSIVALAADEARGRLVASAQYGRMFAITPSGVGQPASESTVELIEPEIGRAHGVLVVDNDLFAVVNEGGGDARGVWRLRDANRDGTYDEKKMLVAIAKDGGEHGPHQVVLAPDGSLWVVGGNHCAVPEPALADSRLPRFGSDKHWEEDIAFDRIWDPNGHAVGVMAPGGWIARTDREGSKWELITAGFRNSYDVAFDEIGRAYTFDSDMEWDMGLPWYRPTRVCELASGVDYGWRSGSGKWPAWSPDSMTPAVDIGPASPTGVLNSLSLQFPPPWNQCMFFLDWTFGTMWAGFITDESRDASSPKFRVEPFVAGRPLPLTDAVAMNGSMYLSVGGRNLPSAVFRVRAENPIAIKRAPMKVPAALIERRELEAAHRPLSGDAATKAIDRAFAALSSNDEGVRSAARIAIEHQDPSLWRGRALAASGARPSILALVALCRMGDAELDGAPVAARLAALESEVRGTPLEREWLRACELWMLRFASRSTSVRGGDALRAALLANYPAIQAASSVGMTWELDLHRANLLAKLGAPEAVTVAVALLERPDTSVPQPVDAALLARGGPYGKAVADMLANAPATQKIGLAYAIRNATKGWNTDLRERFGRSLAALKKGTGGNSFAGFLNRISEEFVSHAPEGERDRLAAAIGGRSIDATLPTPRGPGRAWTVVEMVALGPKLVGGRDYAEGLRAYRATQCAQCHRAGGIGGSGGPELTAVSRRFSLEDLATSLVEPSRTISDQYENTDFRMKDGSVVTGRKVGETADAIEVRTSLLSDARETLAKADIVSASRSPLSPMPANLVDTLSESELLDLLAFLRAGGDAGDSAFVKTDDDGYLDIFNGSSTAGFTFDPRFWAIEGGVLVGRATASSPAPHNTFFVWNGDVRDFELEVVLKVNGNNSGVQYRSELFGEHRLRGPQIDAHPNSPYVAMCYEEGGRGILAERGTALSIAADGKRTTSVLAGAGGAAPNTGEWHTYRVVARGNRMEHFIDDVPTATVVDDSKERAKGGKIGFQIHAGEPTTVSVRSARLKRLDS